jgi:hypothetical protein
MPDPAPRHIGAAAGPAVAAVATFVVHAACGGRYGAFRDEMYFIVCGRRLDWGYVDQPPLVAALARVAHEVFGMWVPGLRLLPWLASAATVWLAGRLALRLGGGAWAALLACAATAASPVLLALGHYLTMNAFEPLLWTALALVLARLAAREDRSHWLAAGAILGLGLLNKYSMGYFAACLAAGIVLVPERRLLLDQRALLHQDEDCGRGTFRRRRLAARLPESPWVMPYESGRWIWICRGPTVPVEALWPRLRHYE